MNKTKQSLLIVFGLIIFSVVFSLVLMHNDKMYNTVIKVKNSKIVPADIVTFKIINVQNQDVKKTSHVFNGAWIDDKENFNQTIIKTSTGNTFNFGVPVTDCIYGYDETMFDDNKSFINPQALLNKSFSYTKSPSYFLTTFIKDGNKETIKTSTKINPGKMKYGQLNDQQSDFFVHNDGFQEEEQIILNQP